MNLKMKVGLSITCLLFAVASFAQDVPSGQDTRKKHLSSQGGEASLGVGLGLPYGGLGLRFGVNATEGLNLFGGVGYQISGVGYNLGIRKDFPSAGMTQFYLMGMYGTNAAIKVVGLPEYNKLYSGPSFGLGVKINSRRTEGNYWDAGLLVPIRSGDYNNDERMVRSDPRIGDFSSPFPVLIVVGYNFSL